jgi:hypothetical protein
LINARNDTRTAYALVLGILIRAQIAVGDFERNGVLDFVGLGPETQRRRLEIESVRQRPRVQRFQRSDLERLLAFPCLLIV